MPRHLLLGLDAYPDLRVADLWCQLGTNCIADILSSSSGKMDSRT
jgi:hypothetical protein